MWIDSQYNGDCCTECITCAYYWENTDTENECNGEDKPCHEFIKYEGIGH